MVKETCMLWLLLLVLLKHSIECCGLLDSRACLLLFFHMGKRNTNAHRQGIPHRGCVGCRISSTLPMIFKQLFPPPLPAMHIKAFLAKRYGPVKPNEASIADGSGCEIGLDKNFGFCEQFNGCYELGEDIGRGHFGGTCSAKAKKGSIKGQEVAPHTSCGKFIQGS